MMKKLILFFLLFCVCYFVNAENNSNTPNFDSLIKKMNLKEKIGQLNAVFIGSFVDWSKPELFPDENKIREYILEKKVGCILANSGRPFTREEWKTLITKIQDISLKESSLKIPVLYGIDAVRGFSYALGTAVFPFNLSIAATREPEYAYKIARITAYDLRSVGIRWNYAPDLDLGYNPLWPRFIETYGEDVTMIKIFGEQAVRGLQGDNQLLAASCLKHFFGYSCPANGKDRTPAYLPDIMLYQYFLPQFKTAIDAGALSIMVNSGELNGVPVHANKQILTKLLRQDLGFRGVVISDANDIEKLWKIHHVANNLKEAVFLAFDAGIDMVMGTEQFPQELLELVQEGKIKEERIDASVKRVLELKWKIGLFDQPYPEKSFETKVDTVFAQKVVLESLTLLKNNDNILPLKSNSKILLTGQMAKSKTSLIGSWVYTWQGDKEDYIPASVNDIYSQFRKELGQKLEYVKPEEFLNEKSNAEAMKIASSCEYIVCCIGEEAYAESSGNINDLELPKEQLNLVNELAKSGKPVVLVLTEGRPRIIRNIEPLTSAILMAYWPGPYGASAIFDVLYGKFNPCGKLPFTYPRYANDIKPYYHKYSDEYQESFIPSFNENEKGFNPQFPFGYGLSYTEFEYTNFKLSSNKIEENGKIEVYVDVKNTGKVAGKETIELYVKDKVASVSPPTKRLVAFQKVNLSAGETKTISFTLGFDQLSFISQDLKPIVEKGTFCAIIKDQSIEFNY
jgi:beta-glucosidase